MLRSQTENLRICHSTSPAGLARITNCTPAKAGKYYPAFGSRGRICLRGCAVHLFQPAVPASGRLRRLFEGARSCGRFGFRMVARWTALLQTRKRKRALQRGLALYVSNDPGASCRIGCPANSWPGLDVLLATCATETIRIGTSPHAGVCVGGY